MRGVAAGYSASGSSAGPLRRGVRQCLAVSCALAAVAARAQTGSCHAQGGRRAVHLQSTRQQRGRMEPGPLRRLSRPGHLADLDVGCGLHRTRALLPAGRSAARRAAVAGERMAQACSGRCLPGARLAMALSDGLRLVAVFEAAKGVLVMLAGFGILALMHRDLQDYAEQLVAHMHLNPAKGYPEIFIDAAANATNARLWMLASFALAYSVVRWIEAYGLWRAKRWAEWVAVASGGIYVPAELYELARGVSWMKVM